VQPLDFSTEMESSLLVAQATFIQMGIAPQLFSSGYKARR
jgi:hypothetical protein